MSNKIFTMDIGYVSVYDIVKKYEGLQVDKTSFDKIFQALCFSGHMKRMPKTYVKSVGTMGYVDYIPTEKGLELGINVAGTITSNDKKYLQWKFPLNLILESMKLQGYNYIGEYFDAKTIETVDGQKMADAEVELKIESAVKELSDEVIFLKDELKASEMELKLKQFDLSQLEQKVQELMIKNATLTLENKQLQELTNN